MSKEIKKNFSVCGAAILNVNKTDHLKASFIFQTFAERKERKM